MELTQDGFLGCRLKLWQPKSGYRAATDPVLLAAATSAAPGQAVLDLGCGVGVAAFCLAARVPDLSVAGIELQPDYAALARKNAAATGLPLEVVDGDLTEMPAALKARSFDHVIANPPFFRAGTVAQETGRAVARHETTDLGAWIDAASRRLRPKGWLTIILPIDRLPDLITALQPGWGDLAMKPLMARVGRAPSRFILKARKGSRGPFRLCPPLILHDGTEHRSDGDDYSAAAKKILHAGEALIWD